MEEEETVKVFTFQHLMSSLITLYTLILIYFPHHLLPIFLSPVLLISGSLLFSLFHLGSTQESNTRPEKAKETEESNLLVCSLSPDTKHDLSGGFVEWNLRAPLEVIHEANYQKKKKVIHEAYEEEDDYDDDDDPSRRFRETERFSSLLLCYPESDSGSDSSSEFDFPAMGKWMSPEEIGYRWEDEEEDGNGGEGLIEIKLDEYHINKIDKQNQTEFKFYGEEEGLIEIHLFP